jgi:hypothetical protein
VKLRTTFLWTLIVSLSLAALLGIVAILMPDLIGADEEILVTASLLGVYSLPALACSIVIGRRRIRWAMWTGVVAAPVAWAIWLPLIWGNPWRWTTTFDWDELLIKLGLTLTFVAIWAAHLGMMVLLRLDRTWFRRARVATIGTVTTLLVIGTPAVWAFYDPSWFVRLISVLGILAGSGTVITPIFALLDVLRRRGMRESVASDLRLRIECPRCGSHETLRVGPSRCAACGLRIETNVEEPRCTCGYLLYKLEGDNCPECGRHARCACGCLVDDPGGKCPKCGRVLSAEAG